MLVPMEDRKLAALYYAVLLIILAGGILGLAFGTPIEGIG